MFRADQLRDLVIRPALRHTGLWSEAAEQLLLLTAAVESRLGTYLAQIGGPAIGIYQIEPATHQDTWAHYLAYRADDAAIVRSMVSPYLLDPVDRRPRDSALILSLDYATVIARIKYRRASEPLPAANDWLGLAEYWKRHYNTVRGAGTIPHAIQLAKDCGVIEG